MSVRPLATSRGWLATTALVLFLLTGGLGASLPTLLDDFSPELTNGTAARPQNFGDSTSSTNTSRDSSSTYMHALVQQTGAGRSLQQVSTCPTVIPPKCCVETGICDTAAASCQGNGLNSYTGTAPPADVK